MRKALSRLIYLATALAIGVGIVACDPSTPAATGSATQVAATHRAKAPVHYSTLTARAWAKVARDPDSYKGEHYIVHGVVTQADADTGNNALRADVCGPVAKKDEYGLIDCPTNSILGDPTGNSLLRDVVEHDIFTAKVTVHGTMDYKNVLGGKTTAPVLYVTTLKVTGTDTGFVGDD